MPTTEVDCYFFLSIMATEPATWPLLPLQHALAVTTAHSFHTSSGNAAFHLAACTMATHDLLAMGIAAMQLLAATTTQVLPS